MAQVTISGRIDLGHQNIETTPENGTSTEVLSLAGDQHGRNTSRLTFAGSEDIGGGLKASFNYETRIAPDNTATPGLDRTRNMFLNLSGGFGSVTIGTYLNPLDAVRGYSAGTYSAPGGDFLANHIGVVGLFVKETDLVSELKAEGLTEASATALAKTVLALASNGLGGRSTNSIGYATNSINGFTANLGVSQEKTSTGANALNKVDGLIGSVAYNKGPLSARYAFGQGKASIKSTALGLNSSKTTDNAFAVSYDLGVAKPYVQHETTKLTVQNIGGEPVTDGGILKSSATEFGASFPMGALAPYVTFGSGKLSLDGEEIKTSAFQVGTTYSLSKRTSIYAATGQFKLKEVQKTTGYKAGLIHAF